MIRPPKLPLPRPKPARLSRGKRMTIAIGIRAVDGVVVAEDRQETFGAQKNDQGKITGGWKRDPFGTLLITGAGTGSYLDDIGAQIRNWFSDNKTERREDIGSVIREMHTKYYSETVLPFSSYPDYERPDYQLLIACTMKGQLPILWTTEKLSFNYNDWDYVAVGIGHATALSLLAKLYARLPVLMAINLAAYVMHEVKSSVDGCGLETDIYYTRDSFIRFVPSGDIREMEDAFKGYRHGEREFLHYCIASDLSHDSRPIAQGKEERHKLHKLFERLNKRRLEHATKPEEL